MYIVFLFYRMAMYVFFFYRRFATAIVICVVALPCHCALEWTQFLQTVEGWKKVAKRRLWNELEESCWSYQTGKIKGLLF